jgi:hypothetical protein
MLSSRQGHDGGYPALSQNRAADTSIQQSDGAVTTPATVDLRTATPAVKAGPMIHNRQEARSRKAATLGDLSTHCDSYRLPGMLLLACRSRVLRAIEFS